MLEWVEVDKQFYPSETLRRFHQVHGLHALVPVFQAVAQQPANPHPTHTSKQNKKQCTDLHCGSSVGESRGAPPLPRKPWNIRRPACRVKPLKRDSLAGRRTTSSVGSIDLARSAVAGLAPGFDKTSKALAATLSCSNSSKLGGSYPCLGLQDSSVWPLETWRIKECSNPTQTVINVSLSRKGWTTPIIAHILSNSFRYANEYIKSNFP